MGHAVRRWRREPRPRPAARPGAPVLGFRQPVAALTHVATGPASQSRNSINKARAPSTAYTVLERRLRGRGCTICLPPRPLPLHVTCQPLPLMSNILGYHSYGLNSAPLPLRNEAVTQLVFAFQSPPLPPPSTTTTPTTSACKLAHICPRRRGEGAGRVLQRSCCRFFR